MASLFSFGEDNGASTGSPATGLTRTWTRTESNWKAIDDSTTAYSSSPITAGNNSYSKYQFGVITGTFNQVSNGKFGHTTGTFGAGLTLVAKVDSGYVTPATTALAGATNVTVPSGITQAAFTVTFAGNGPQYANASSMTVTGYTQYLITQLQTTTGASAGDTAQVTLTLQYDES